MTADRPENDAPGLSQQAATSVLWNGGGTAAVQTVALVTYVVVAWHLGPREFGTVAMAMALVALARMLVDFGLAPAIITGRLSGGLETLSAHWLVCLWGLCWSCVLIAIAPLAAAFFQNEQVTSLLRLAALLPAVDATATVAQAMLQSRHRFDQIVRVDLACQLGVAVGAISMAVMGYGVWSLVLPQLLGRVVRAVGICSLAPIRYRPRFSLASLRSSFAESGHVMGAASTNYVYTNADNIIIGRFFGAHDLGRYSFAYNCLARTLTVLSHAVSTPILASLGQLRDDVERFDRAVVRAARTVARLTFPLTLGGALVAPLLIEVLFDERWADTTTLIRWFLPLAALQSIGALTGAVWLALGRSRLMLWWGVVTTVLATGVFAGGAMLGSVETVAASFALFSAFGTSPAAYHLTRRVCGLPLTGLLRGLGIVLLDAGIMVAAVAAVAAALEPLGLRPLVMLVLQVGTGGLVYAVLLRSLHPQELAELLSLLPRRLREPLGAISGMTARA